MRILILVLLCTVFGHFSFSQTPTNKPYVPVKNQRVLEFVDDHLNTKVGRGECWDLAAEALDFAGADWSYPYKFGLLLNDNFKKVLPGDIIQFKNVSLRKKTHHGTLTVKMRQHTAIVYEVISNGKYRIAEQNTSEFGRKVGISELDLNDMAKGKVSIYRPQ